MGSSRVVGFAHAYDNETNKRFEERRHDPAHSESYTYDAADRLTSAKVGQLVGPVVPVPVTQTAYDLDAVGNWNSKTTDSVTQTRTHNAANEITSIDSTTITHDDDGNLSNDGQNTYAYDEENRL